MRNYLDWVGLWEYLRRIFLIGLTEVGSPTLNVSGTVLRTGLGLMECKGVGAEHGRARIHCSLLLTKDVGDRSSKFPLLRLPCCGRLQRGVVSNDTIPLLCVVLLGIILSS